MHLRHQVVLSICMVQLAALVFGAAVLVLNARNAVRLEVASGEQSTRALVLATLGSMLQDMPAAEVVPRLADVLVEARHVDLAVVGSSQGVVPVRDMGDDDGLRPAPAWFHRLVAPEIQETRFPIRKNGLEIGFVSMRTAPGDEIAEVWQDVKSLFWIVAGAAAVSAALLIFLVTRSLRPLDRLRQALLDLRDGDRATRLGRPAVADLAPIFEGFDALSHGLHKAETERQRLNRRIVELGDAERRSIANELHDEFGPCLFGLKVKAASIARAARAQGDANLAEDAEAILAIVAEIQGSNARLLTTLRPMAIGQLPLGEALDELFGAFRKAHPAIDWQVDLEAELPDTPEILDLTVYRFFQEGITNALRHGDPQRITARLRLAGGAEGGLRLEVEDDGLGLAPGRREGRGLTAMRDRIGALGGRLVIGETEAGGTQLSARVPLAPPVDTAPATLRAVS